MPSNKIAKDYDSFFKSDPLLLQEGSQKKYIDKLLNNILGHRSQVSSLPEDLILSEPESVAQFKRKPPKTVKAPTPEDALALAVAYRRRVAVPEENFKRLREITMVTDGSWTLNRAETLNGHDDAIAELSNSNARSTLDKRLRIAAVGYRVKISKLPGQALLNEHLCFLAPPVDAPVCHTLDETKGIHELGRTRIAPNADLEKWTKTIDDFIKRTHKRQSHIVVLPEFALPAASSRAKTNIESQLHATCSSATYDHYVFAGSRHEGGYNRGMVFHKSKGVCPEPHWHYKVASARTLGENILGPHHNKLASYTSHVKLEGVPQMDIAISVALCYDSFDPSMFLSLVNQGLHLSLEEDWETVILVPSFNPSDDFVALLRDLSFLARSVVVYVNSLHGNAKLFICGFAVSDFADDKEGMYKYVTDFQDQLHAQHEQIQEKMKRIKNRNTQEYRQLNRRLGKLASRMGALRNLWNSLEALEGIKGLDEILTVEPCDHCGKLMSHATDTVCHRDILYYNLDPRLLVALRKFRADYIDDSALPSSLRA